MILRYIGLAKETSFNESPAPAATIHLDIASATLDTPSDTELIYEGGLSRGVRIHRPGFYSPSGNFAYAFDIRSIGYLLKWALGGYKFTTGAPALNTHEFWGDSNIILPSFCARLGKDNFEHVFSGCTINSLELKVEGEYCVVTIDVNAAKDTKDTLKNISDLLLPEEYPLAFHEMTISRTGDVSAKFKDFTLTISNELNAESGRSIGSRYPRRIVAGAREVAFSANLWFEDTTELETFWGGTSGPVNTGTTEFSLTLNFNSGAAGNMEILLPKCIYTQVQQQPSGRDEIVQAIAGRAFTDEITLDDAITKVESEILVTLQNNATEI